MRLIGLLWFLFVSYGFPTLPTVTMVNVVIVVSIVSVVAKYFVITFLWFILSVLLPRMLGFCGSCVLIVCEVDKVLFFI